MKNTTLLMITFVLVSLSAILMSYNTFEPPQQFTLDLPINPAHEKKPPIAEKVEIVPITSKKGNILFKAWIKEGTFTSVMKAPKFSLQLPSGKVVLRDDGTEGDEEPHDGIFSVILNDKIEDISNTLKLKEDEILSKKKVSLFEGRVASSLSPKKALAKLNLGTLNEQLSGFNQKVSSVKFSPAVLQVNGPVADVVKSNSLFITDLGVVEDDDRTFNPCNGDGTSDGVWTFGELMRQLASPDPSNIATDVQTIAFILSFLNTWENNANIVNNDVLDVRSVQDIKDDWLALSGGGSIPNDLDLSRFPVKLTAIVNRSDLAGNTAYGVTSGGEGRFIFCLLDGNCNDKRMNFIFEYGVNKTSCSAFKAYVNQWWELQNLQLGSTAYKEALQEITDQFTLSGTNPNNLNQSSLNQLRTNELTLGSPWELREFNLQQTQLMGIVRLKPTTTKLEPQLHFNKKKCSPSPTIDEETLADFVNTNQTDVINERHDVPLTFNGLAFLGAHAQTGSPTGTPTSPACNSTSMDNFPHHWDSGLPTHPTAGIAHDEARHKFSLNTCSGCHGGETQCRTIDPNTLLGVEPFVHVETVSFGEEATLSGFLTGLGVDHDLTDNDSDLNGEFFVTDAAGRPSGNPDIRGFNDLERRGIELENDVNTSCGFVIGPVFTSPSIQLAEALSHDVLNSAH